MPSSLSWSEDREKRASQVGNFEACALRPRPIRVRKVGTSGQKGVGSGISGRVVDVEAALIPPKTGSIEFLGVVCRIEDVKAGRRSCGRNMGCSLC
jgi:hypothetical protein